MWLKRVFGDGSGLNSNVEDWERERVFGEGGEI